MIILLVSKHRFSFSSQNLIFLYSIPDLTYENPYPSRFARITYSKYLPGLGGFVKACPIMRMSFKIMTAGYINTLLTWDIESRAIYNLLLLNDGII